LREAYLAALSKVLKKIKNKIVSYCSYTWRRLFVHSEIGRRSQMSKNSIPKSQSFGYNKNWRFFQITAKNYQSLSNFSYKLHKSGSMDLENK
jgi:hypothetical protein